jgi:hypothetical protein
VVKKMRVWFLITLLCVIAVCNWFGPGTALERSATQALDSAIHVLSQGDDDEVPQSATATLGRGAPSPTDHRTGARNPHRPGGVPSGTPSTAPKRKRITPFVAKKVAARQRWRCAMCGELLSEDYEIDHIVPLHRGGSFDNDIDSLQAIHKRCHLFKNSLEQRRS